MMKRSGWLVSLVWLSTLGMAAADDEGLGSGPPMTRYGQAVTGECPVLEIEPEPGPHPDADFQQQLQAAAQQMAADGVPGVELWSEVVRLAVEHHAPRTDLTTEEKYDAVMRDVTAVLVGEGQPVDKIRLMQNVMGVNNPLMDTMVSEFGRMDTVKAGSDLDSTGGQDFRSAFNDGSSNQIFHTHFYVFLAYASGSASSVNQGNYWHEIAPNGGSGGSYADYKAGEWGAVVGEMIRQLRDSGSEEGLYALPTIFGAAFSADPSTYGLPEDNDGRDFTGLRDQVDQTIRDRMFNPGGGLGNWLLEARNWGMINLINRLHGN